MSREVDQRVVEMQFDQSKFGSGVSTTIGWLDKLKSALKLDGASKGIDDVSNAAGKVDLSPIGHGVQGIMGQFSALQVTAITALSNIVNKAVNAGTQLAKSLTIAPISDGFKEYETNMTSIQTILANTKASGATLTDVNAALDDLNHYSDKTIYNFSEMAKNIGTFTAAGVNLDTATGSIKGIANLAALSGSNSEQASGAMYQLSQAISSGKVSLMDWNSVVNAGMGGTVFQRALAQTATKMGTLSDGAVSLTGDMKNVSIEGKSFRDSIDATNGPSWLTSDVLTKTLQQFTGDMTDAQLAAEGFSEAQISDIQSQATTAVNAATEVKTLSGLMDTLKESVGSGWSQTFKLIFGDFEESKALFTGLNNSIGGFLGRMSDGRNKLLQDWKDLGGRTALIDGLKNAFSALSGVLVPIGSAFRDAFPATSAKSLYNMTVAFRDFMADLKPSGQTMTNIARTASGFFAILGIGWDILKGLVGFVSKFFMGVEEGDKGILKTTATIGDFFYRLRQTLQMSGGIEKFFDMLFKAAMKVVNPIKDAGQWIGNLFQKFADQGGSLGGIADEFGQIGDKLSPLASIGEKVGSIFGKLGGIFRSIGAMIGQALGGIGDAIADNFSLANFDRIIDLINTGLFATIAFAIKNFLGSFGKGGGERGPSFLDKIKESLEALTGTMEAMQTKLKSDALMGIAIAIGVMAAALLILSLIDADALAKSLVAMAIGFGIMAAGMVKLSSSIGLMGTLKLPLITGSLVALAGALMLMALAMKIMATMELGDMLRGLFGMGAALAVIAGAMRLMPKNITMQSLALIALGVGLNAIALAMKLFATISWEEMGRGLAGMAGALIAIAVGMRLMPKNILLQAVALNVLSTALAAMVGVMKLMNLLSWEEIGRGLAGIGGSLVVIGAAMRLMPKNMLLQAVALNAVAVALNVMAFAIQSFGGMTWEEMAKGLLMLAGSLVIIAGALNLMNGTLMGSAALVVAVAALTVLVPVLLALGAMSWEAIIKGLTMLAGVFLILGVAGVVLSEAVPVILALGAAVVLIGAGFALAGVGALAFAAGFALVVATAAAGIGVLGAVIALLIGSIEPLARAIAEGIVAIVETIGHNVPVFAEAFSNILGGIIDVIEENVPKIINMFYNLVIGILDAIEHGLPLIIEKGGNIIIGFLDGMNRKLPQIIDKGSQLIINLLNGIARNLPGIITAATNVVVAFINGISANLPRIIQSGINLIINFVNGVANGIRSNSAAMGAAGGNLATAIVEGMVKGIAGGIGSVVDAAKNLAKGALNAAKDFLGIHSPSKEFEKLGQFSAEGFALGLVGDKDKINDAVTELLSQVDDAWAKNVDTIASNDQKYSDLVTKRNENAHDLAAANEDLAKAQNMDVSSDAKTADARRDETAKKIEARNNAIQAAEEKVHNLTNAFNDQTAAMNDVAAANQDLRDENNRMNDARVFLIENMLDERDLLVSLADQRDVVVEAIKDEQKALEDATKTRDDYNNSIRDQYGAQETVTKDTHLSDYLTNLRQQIVDTQQFAIAIQELRKNGLNDELYKSLLSAGPTAAMPFVQELLAGGQTALDDINSLGSSLDVAAGSLGDAASSSLYQAGVDAAAGLLKGLQDQQAGLEWQMQQLADYMVWAFNTRLGIHSPSRVFAKLGGYTVQGLAKGLEDSASVVGSAAEGVGQTAIDSMKKTISGLGDLISGEVDVIPVIRPVLDLTSIKKDASSIDSMLSAQSLSVGVAYAKAGDASAGYNANQNTVAETSTTETPAPISFTQINNSPKALSSADIYRQTNNQISVAKGALTSNVSSKGRS